MCYLLALIETLREVRNMKKKYLGMEFGAVTGLFFGQLTAGASGRTDQNRNLQAFQRSGRIHRE